MFEAPIGGLLDGISPRLCKITPFQQFKLAQRECFKSNNRAAGATQQNGTARGQPVESIMQLTFPRV